jgi:hypothetical protein
MFTEIESLQGPTTLYGRLGPYKIQGEHTKKPTKTQNKHRKTKKMRDRDPT